MTAIAIAAIALVAVPAVGAQSPSAEDLFARASVDDERPYLGQQITYRLRIYREKDAGLSLLSVSPPDFAGFWNSQETIHGMYEETMGARRYQVDEVRTVLFASVAGAKVIEPAVMEVASMTPRGVTVKELASPTVAVEVRSLPMPEPAGFTGAVGRFEISARADTTQGRLNEPLRLTVRISGEGNIEALPYPEWPDFPGWRVIESPASVESRLTARWRIEGNRTYQMTLIPKESGSLAIPEIRYSYFDPAIDSYVDIATIPFAVRIADVGGSAVSASVHASGAPEDEFTQFRPIKTTPSSLSREHTELTGLAAYWAVWAIPALAIAGALAWRRRRAAQEASRVRALHDAALPDARAALDRAVRSGVDPRVAAAEAVQAYISARLETPVKGLTREALIQRLRDAGAPPHLENRVSETLAAGESARYVPVGGSAGNRARQTSQLLGELEEAIGG